MAFFRVKVADKVYELDRLTLGDSWLLKQRFGLQDLTEFNPTDPGQLVGLMFLAMTKEHPTKDADLILAEIKALDIDDFDPEPEAEVKPDDELDPTPADVTPAEASEPPPEASGASETTPVNSGDLT